MESFSSIGCVTNFQSVGEEKRNLQYFQVLLKSRVEALDLNKKDF